MRIAVQKTKGPLNSVTILAGTFSYIYGTPEHLYYWCKTLSLCVYLSSSLSLILPSGTHLPTQAPSECERTLLAHPSNCLYVSLPSWEEHANASLMAMSGLPTSMEEHTNYSQHPVQSIDIQSSSHDFHIFPDNSTTPLPKITRTTW